MMVEICSRFLPLIYSDKSKILKEPFTLGDWIKLLKDKGHSFAWDSPTEDGQGNLQIMVMGVVGPPNPVDHPITRLAPLYNYFKRLLFTQHQNHCSKTQQEED